MAKEYLKVNNQLIMVDGKLVEVPSETEASDALDEQAETIAATQEQADETVNQIIGYIDGSPRGFKDSLTALQTEYPNGAVGVYVTNDNGHLVYYNGTAWVDSGRIYQATGINDKSINEKKLAFVSIGKNLFDKNNVEDGLYYYGNGSYSSDANYVASDFIPVLPSTIYQFNGTAHVCYYNSSKEYISGALLISSIRKFYTFTTTSNTAYIRISPTKDFIDNYVLCLKDETNILEPFTYVINAKTKKEYNTDYYSFMFVKDQKVICNKLSPDADYQYQYATIDFKSKPTKLVVKFVFDNFNVTKLATVALICNTNGANSIYDITNSSIHVTIASGHMTLHALGQKYGEYYYHTFFYEDISPILKTDGTENILTMERNGEIVTCTLNGTSYSGTFSDDKNMGRTLDDFWGQYCTFETSCNNPIAQFIEFYVKDNTHVAFDNFKREDGILTSTPTGEIYHLFNNDYHYGNLKDRY